MRKMTMANKPLETTSGTAAAGERSPLSGTT
jgi:hypothetical protein